MHIKEVKEEISTHPETRDYKFAPQPGEKMQLPRSASLPEMQAGLIAPLGGKSPAYSKSCKTSTKNSTVTSQSTLNGIENLFCEKNARFSQR